MSRWDLPVSVNEKKIAAAFDEMGLEEREAIARKYCKCRSKSDLERLDWMYANWIGVHADAKKRIYPHVLEAIKNKRIAEKVSRQQEANLRVRVVDYGAEPDV